MFKDDWNKVKQWFILIQPINGEGESSGSYGSATFWLPGSVKICGSLDPWDKIPSKNCKKKYFFDL